MWTLFQNVQTKTIKMARRREAKARHMTRGGDSDPCENNIGLLSYTCQEGATQAPKEAICSRATGGPLTTPLQRAKLIRTGAMSLVK